MLKAYSTMVPLPVVRGVLLAADGLFRSKQPVQPFKTARRLVYTVSLRVGVPGLHPKRSEGDETNMASGRLPLTMIAHAEHRDLISIPLPPGAERFYRERGMLPKRNPSP
jgi:hypothetical protein